MKAHRTDGVSLVFALIFLALAGWWLLAQILDLTLPAVGWFLAGALILIGVLGLLGALRSGRSAPPAAVPAAVPPHAEPSAASLDEREYDIHDTWDDTPTRELRYAEDAAEPRYAGGETRFGADPEPATEPGGDRPAGAGGDLDSEPPPGRPDGTPAEPRLGRE